MHLPFAQLVVMPINAGLTVYFSMLLVARVRRRVSHSQSHSQDAVVPPPPSGQISILVVGAWLVSAGIYLWLIPGSKFAALQGLAVGEGVFFVLGVVIFGSLAVLSAFFPGQRPRKPMA